MAVVVVVVQGEVQLVKVEVAELKSANVAYPWQLELVLDSHHVHQCSKLADSSTELEQDLPYCMDSSKEEYSKKNMKWIELNCTI